MLILGNKKATSVIIPKPGGVCYTNTGFPPTLQNVLEYPFNSEACSRRPIGKGAVYSPVTAPQVVDLRKGPRININSGNNFGHRWAYGTDTDPLVQVVRNKNGGLNLPVSLRVPKNFTGGTVDAGADQGVTIYDRTTNICHQFFQFYRRDDNNATSAGRYTYDPRGIDWGSPRKSSSASQICQLGLILRGREINPGAGAPPIQHCLHIAMGRRPDHDYMQLSREVIWPANGTDGDAFKIVDGKYVNNNGSVAYGTLYAIPTIEKGGPDFNTIASISTPQQRRYAQCARDYGIYVVDGGVNMSMRGDPGIDPGVRSSLTTGAFASWFVDALRMVTNNQQSQDTAGGGEPLANNCAYNSSGIEWDPYP